MLDCGVPIALASSFGSRGDAIVEAGIGAVFGMVAGIVYLGA